MRSSEKGERGKEISRVKRPTDWDRQFVRAQVLRDSTKKSQTKNPPIPALFEVGAPESFYPRRGERSFMHSGCAVSQAARAL